MKNILLRWRCDESLKAMQAESGIYAIEFCMVRGLALNHWSSFQCFHVDRVPSAMKDAAQVHGAGSLHKVNVYSILPSLPIPSLSALIVELPV